MIVVQLWERMRDIMTSCPCRDGCPRCVESPTRFSQVAEPDKSAAIGLLDMMIGSRCLNGAEVRELPAPVCR